ncbi:alpha/beta fold hydrolase [Kordiimonas pumila]|uniref:Alpha/beta fold hydrolase n=1 Tax=Kordiimonas pumila TaxID=2161677 RepID=A0ABV7D0J0_9PROT|nr:alpha/beta hydrolase [Kordiimonas pumila]
MVESLSTHAAEPDDVFVNVLGGKLHFKVYKGNEKVVLLESGAGFGAEEWDTYAPDLAAATGATVISYDREGKGESDGLDTDYDVHNEMVRLHGGLYALGYSENLYLVGHSYGGYLIQLYSNIYPGDVKGLVYVDVVTTKGIDAFGAGELQSRVLKRNDVAEPDKKQLSNLRMGHGYVRTHEIMRQYPVVCGVPVAVITAGKVSSGLDSAIVAGWQEGHSALVEHSNGKHLFAEKSGHMVPWDQPDIITEAVQYALDAGADANAVLGEHGKRCSMGESE